MVSVCSSLKFMIIIVIIYCVAVVSVYDIHMTVLVHDDDV
jgi:hypothetical protein